MSTRTRRLLMGGVPVGLLVVAVVWSYGRLIDSRDAALGAARAESDCAGLIRRIEALRSRPSAAGAEELRVTELTGRIEEAAKRAQCPAGSIVRIEPEAARRIGDTPYLEKPAQLVLRDVTLRQTVGLLHGLSSDAAGLGIKSIRLSAPRGAEAGDRWTADCTLSYLIYSPRASAVLAGGER